MVIARAHANRFYNFRGLERFRTKMQPSGWEPIYAISNERHFSPRALYAMGAPLPGISPLHGDCPGGRKERGKKLLMRVQKNNPFAHRVKDQIGRAVQ